MDLFIRLFGSLLVLVIPLLRSHRHPWLLEWAVAARTGGSFCPSGARYPGGEQRGAQPAHPRLSDLGGGLCPPSSDPDGMGQKGVRKEDYVLPALRRLEKQHA